jgi:hypothetical protein
MVADKSNASLSLRNNSRNAQLALGVSVQPDPNFAWMQEVRLAPIQAPVPADQLRFDNNAVARPDNRTYSSGNKPLPSDVQWIAIRFQR